MLGCRHTAFTAHLFFIRRLFCFFGLRHLIGHGSPP
jgi:hypothetical protein